MIPCPKGAIVRHDELALLYDATVQAVDNLECLISSDHIPNPKLRDATSRATERQRRRLLGEIKHIQKRIREIGLKHRREQELRRA